MKNLVTVGLLVAMVAFAGTAYAGRDDSVLQDIDVQKLMEWSAQVADQAAKAKQTAGPGARPTNPVPPYQQYPSGIR